MAFEPCFSVEIACHLGLAYQTFTLIKVSKVHQASVIPSRIDTAHDTLRSTNSACKLCGIRWLLCTYLVISKEEDRKRCYRVHSDEKRSLLQAICDTMFLESGREGATLRFETLCPGHVYILPWRMMLGTRSSGPKLYLRVLEEFRIIHDSRASDRSKKRSTTLRRSAVSCRGPASPAFEGLLCSSLDKQPSTCGQHSVDQVM